MSQDKPLPGPVRIINDNPATKKTNLGYEAHADTLAGVLANKENSTPLVMGVYGTWGSGKTTLMAAIRSRLDEGALEDPKRYRRCKTIWFNAWKHAGKETPLAALIESVLKAMDTDGFFGLAKTRIEEIAKRIDKSNLFPSVSKLGAGADISEFFSDMAYKENLGFYDTFQKYFNDLVWTFLNWRFKTTQEEKPDDTKVALVIFIDDLDRCTGDHIVKVLETINLFLARTGWMFVLGASKQSLETALNQKYDGAAARHIMEKIVPLSFDLPQVNTEEFDLLLETANVEEKHRSLLIAAIDHNPRKLKRFINSLNMLHGLLCSADIGISLENVLHWGILGCIYPDLATDIKDNPHNLFTLQKQIKRLEAKWGDKPIGLLTEEQLKEEKVPHKLRAHLHKPPVIDFLKAFDVTLEQYTGMLSLSHSVDVEGCTPFRDEASAPLPLSRHAMASIAAGPLMFGDDKATTRIDASFDIDIYLVTNGQFRIFMDAGGYANQTWWSQKGWLWRKDTGVRNPAHWDDSKWNRNDHPVVGLSWYEADAYARWVGMALPTEQQWERAARGVDGWEYPWGNAFDHARCNAQTSAITTPVYRYSNGISPEGCYDMAGNVWEWTASQVEDEDQETYIIKGGSWSDDADAARCASRRSVRPDLRHSTVGLRCVRKTIQHSP